MKAGQRGAYHQNSLLPPISDARIDNNILQYQVLFRTIHELDEPVKNQGKLVLGVLDRLPVYRVSGIPVKCIRWFGTLLAICHRTYRTVWVRDIDILNRSMRENLLQISCHRLHSGLLRSSMVDNEKRNVEVRRP